MSLATIACPVTTTFPTARTTTTEAKARRASESARARVRRRHIDPTTCERDYSASELEFMQAMQAYKGTSGRMFPTWSEALEVLRTLGYAKVEAGVSR